MSAAQQLSPISIIIMGDCGVPFDSLQRHITSTSNYFVTKSPSLLDAFQTLITKGRGILLLNFEEKKYLTEFAKIFQVSVRQLNISQINIQICTSNQEILRNKALTQFPFIKTISPFSEAKALVLGAKLAADLLDYGASDWYLKQANLIQHSILGFWDSRVNYLGATQNWKGGVDYKHSNLDIAVILGVLHGHSEELNIKFTDERIVRTKNQLVKTFSSLYEINRNAQAPGVAIGRYSEDRYDGYHFRYGNPWVLSTLAIAEYYYKSAVEVAKSKKNGIKEIQKYINTGDSFVKRVQFHANPDGSLSEQMDRYSGYMTSAPELTWNYAAIITAYLARQNAQNVLSNLKNH